MPGTRAAGRPGIAPNDESGTAAAKPTIKDVARLAGVSIGSVSRVLNGKATVTADIREKVDAAIRALGFQPHSAAQTMRSRTTQTVGCIIRDIAIPGFARFVRAAHDILLGAGYSLFLSNSDGIAERERQLVSVMAARQVDGLIIGQYSDDDPAFSALLQRSRFPVVMVDRAEPAWADAVLIDHRGGARLATECLLRFGHRRIALLTGRDTLFPARERIAGFRDAFAAQGLAPLDGFVRTGSFEREFGFEQTSLLLNAPAPPTAIVIGGIDMLPGVIRAIRVRGLSIPGDVSLVAALTTELTELFEPSISVENWDYAEAGRLAARFLLERMRSPDAGAAKRVLVPTELLLRNSIAPPPVGR